VQTSPWGCSVCTTTSPAMTMYSVFDSRVGRVAEYGQATRRLIREYVLGLGEARPDALAVEARQRAMRPRTLSRAGVAVIEGGVTSLVRTDHIGRPVFATNTNGVKVWTASYTPFGGVRTVTGTPVNARFPGQWFQAESGLHQNWMRDYDPATGRYLQADPLGLVDSASVYGYARQSPMMMIDPTGELGLASALAGTLIGMVAGYQQTGCWQGAAIGALTGLAFGALTPDNVYWAMASAGTNALVSQALSYIALDSVCGCNKQEWNSRKAALVALGSTLGGGLGYGLGGGLSGAIQNGGRLYGGETGGPIIGGTI
jgi:RHS repeat-associated protein